MKTKVNSFAFCRRRIVVIAVAMFVGGRISAQTNAEPATNVAPVINTNVWTTMPWYREVNGNVYDPQRSAMWKQLHGLAEIKEILPDAVIWQWCKDKQVLNNQNQLIGVNRIYGKKFIVQHDSLEIVTAGPTGFEPAGTLKVGGNREMNGLLVMYVGTTNYNGEALPVWDCGERVKSPTVTIITTNYPSLSKGAH